MNTSFWRTLALLAVLSAAPWPLAGSPAEAGSGEETPAALLERLLPADEDRALPLTVAQACCKTCRKGKACGDSCIAREKLCEKPRGCACDAKPLQ